MDDNLRALTVTELIERTSLGQPAALRWRRQCPPSVRDEILRRIHAAEGDQA